MELKKTKIVLDADVIIHFIKGGSYNLLPDIFPEYEYIILDVVYNELSSNRNTKRIIDNSVEYLKKVRVVDFAPKGFSNKEYAFLCSTLGKGESACMIYCKDNKDVLGSSNLRDVKTYCESNGITYLTTIDFLYYAYVKK